MSQMASDTVCQYNHNGHLMRIKGSFYRQKLSIFIQNPEFSLIQNHFFHSDNKSKKNAKYLHICVPVHKGKMISN